MMLRPAAGIALLLLMAGAATAQQLAAPDPGWTYRVVGVEAGDKVSVHQDPTREAPTVGEFAGDAKGVILTGSIQDDGTDRWLEVVLPGGKGTGFVNAAFLEEDRESGERTSNFPLACIGTEPFWSLTTAEGTVKMSSPAGDGSFPASAWLQAPPNSIDQTLRIGEGGYLVAQRGAGDCSPGMGETIYPYWGLVVLPDGSVQSGCCARGG